MAPLAACLILASAALLSATVVSSHAVALDACSNDGAPWTRPGGADADGGKVKGPAEVPASCQPPPGQAEEVSLLQRGGRKLAAGVAPSSGTALSNDRYVPGVSTNNGAIPSWCQPTIDGICLKKAWAICGLGNNNGMNASYCFFGMCTCSSGYCGVGKGIGSACQAAVGGSCYTGVCDASRGPAKCIKGTCICPVGYIADRGVCVSRTTSTGGTCVTSGKCDASRGPVKCDSGFCKCLDGYFAVEGVCRKNGTALNRDTGGTCGLGTCAKSRGGGVECVKSKCICREGFYAEDGKCIPDVTTFNTDTGGTCNFGKCAASRNAQCVDGKCLCAEGYFADDGACYAINGTQADGPAGEDTEGGSESSSSETAASATLGGTESVSRDTGGTCSWSACSKSRGEGVECVHTKCMCKENYYAEGGACKPANLPADTGGTCSFSPCSSSRHAQCVKGKCVCGSGTYAQSGQCISL